MVQEVHESYINDFSGKFLFETNGPFLGPKMARPLNSGFALRIFCKFCAMAEAKRYMKIVLMVFPKKFSFRGIGSFWAPKVT